MRIDNPLITRGLTPDGAHRRTYVHAHATKLASADDPLAHARLPVIRTCRPGGHHFTKYAVTTVSRRLCSFSCSIQMTGGFWQSAFVASLVRHSSVARRIRRHGCSERKDVLLSAVFFMLTPWALCALRAQRSIRWPLSGRGALLCSGPDVETRCW